MTTPPSPRESAQPADAGAHSPEFVAIPGRDASAAIRGFAYQVDTTVLRWLDLGDGETLELECGEDIDLIGRAVEANPQGGPPPETVRVLEQVKNRTAALTLRSSEARAVLAQFYEHRTANPALRLVLRFTTTARLGPERDRASRGEGEEPLVVALGSTRDAGARIPPSSLGPQRGDRIHSRGAPRREQGGQRGDHQERRGDEPQHRRVARRDSV